MSFAVPTHFVQQYTQNVMMLLQQKGGKLASTVTQQSFTGKGAKVILSAHFGRPKGQVNEAMRLTPVAARLSELLGKRKLVQLLRSCNVFHFISLLGWVCSRFCKCYLWGCSGTLSVWWDDTLWCFWYSWLSCRCRGRSRRSGGGSWGPVRRGR